MSIQNYGQFARAVGLAPGAPTQERSRPWVPRKALSDFQYVELPGDKIEEGDSILYLDSKRVKTTPEVDSVERHVTESHSRVEFTDGGTMLLHHERLYAVFCNENVWLTGAPPKGVRGPVIGRAHGVEAIAFVFEIKGERLLLWDECRVDWPEHPTLWREFDDGEWNAWAFPHQDGAAELRGSQ